MKNTIKSFVLLALVIMAIAACKHEPIVPPKVPAPPISFKNDVQPILAGNCNAADGCHGAVNTEEYTVLTYSGVRSQVEAGDPEDSEIIERITSNDEDKRMPQPPSAKLTAEQIAIISTWISEGAIDN